MQEAGYVTMMFCWKLEAPVWSVFRDLSLWAGERMHVCFGQCDWNVLLQCGGTCHGERKLPWEGKGKL